MLLMHNHVYLADWLKVKQYVYISQIYIYFNRFENRLQGIPKNKIHPYMYFIKTAFGLERQFPHILLITGSLGFGNLVTPKYDKVTCTL